MEYYYTSESLLATAAIILLAWWYLSKNTKQPPGPTGIPILGYLPFIGNQPAKTYHELSKKYGPVLSLKLGPETFIVLNDYESIHEAFARKASVFSGRPNSAFIEAFTGGYGFALHQYDKELKMHRKFFLKTLRCFGLDKKNVEKKVMEEFEYFSNTIKSTKEEPTNCRTLLARSTANVIFSVILGSRFSYDDEEFQKLVHIVNQDFVSDKVVAFCLNLMLVAPGLRLIPPFSNTLKFLIKSREYIKERLRRSVELHRSKLDRENPRDYIDEYLLKLEDEHDPLFCERQLYETITDLFLAGTETTSSTISWGLLVLAHRPDIQRKLQQEILKVVGDDTPSMNHKSDLPYVNAFILELMRHRTLAPVALPHSALENIRFKDFDIRKGATILPNIWAVHHDPVYFKNPDQFNPERFIDVNGNFTNDPRVIPFSLGPRYCLGEQLARLELFLFLANIMQRFEVRGNPATLPSIHDGVFGTAYVPKEFQVSFVSR